MSNVHTRRDAPDPELLAAIENLDEAELLAFRDECSGVLLQRPDAPPGTACHAFGLELATTTPDEVRALLRYIVEQRALKGDR